MNNKNKKYAVETVEIEVGDKKLYRELRQAGFNCIASDNGVVYMCRLVNWQELSAEYIDSAEYHYQLTL
jgi:uncharacterized protein Smg (DUF494 family)